jgi:hypothetical protein
MKGLKLALSSASGNCLYITDPDEGGGTKAPYALVRIQC